MLAAAKKESALALPIMSMTRFTDFLRLRRPARRPVQAARARPSTSGAIFPYPGIWSVGSWLPAPAVELLDPERAEIHAFQTAHVDHVFRGVGSRPIERGDAAVPAKEMARCKSAELIGLQVLRSGEQAEPLGRHHVMQVALL